MEHRLITAVEAALGWSGSSQLGGDFARGSINDLALAERILTPNRLLDLVLRRSLSSPQFRCFQGGEELHPNAYLTDEVSLRGQSIRMVNTHRLGVLLRQGATAVLDQVNTFDPTMEVACRALEWWSRERVQVNAYLTTNDAAGFRLHWDDHDVVIVQLAGEKEWEVRGPSRTAPLYRDADHNNEPSDDIVWAGTIRAGDVMHIPRGYWHQATRDGIGSGKSLHMTFGFAKRTGVNWLSWLADWSREQEIFRHDLDRSQRTGSDALTEAAVGLMRQRGPADFLSVRDRKPPSPGTYRSSTSSARSKRSPASPTSRPRSPNGARRSRSSRQARSSPSRPRPAPRSGCCSADTPSTWRGPPLLWEPRSSRSPRS